MRLVFVMNTQHVFFEVRLHSFQAAFNSGLLKHICDSDNFGSFAVRAGNT
jgi:hypothetical protein